MAELKLAHNALQFDPIQIFPEKERKKDQVPDNQNAGTTQAKNASVQNQNASRQNSTTANNLKPAANRESANHSPDYADDNFEESGALDNSRAKSPMSKENEIDDNYNF